MAEDPVHIGHLIAEKVRARYESNNDAISKVATQIGALFSGR
jgi:hypothetical protein